MSSLLYAVSNSYDWMLRLMPTEASSDLSTIASACPATSPLTVIRNALNPCGYPACASSCLALVGLYGYGEMLSSKYCILYGMNDAPAVAWPW